MRIGQSLRTLGAGAVFYVVMAACSASDRAAGLAASDGGGADAFVDQLTSPVTDAKADPLPPDVAKEPCNKVLKFGTTDYYVAEHVYPGKSVEELALVHALAAPFNALEGYSQQVSSLPFVRYGRVAVVCSAVSDGPTTDTVTFVLPR